MSADISSAISGAGPAGRPAPVAPAPVEAASVRPASPDVKAPPAPDKARIDFDPRERDRELDEAIKRLNEQMQSNGRALDFSVDKVLDRTVVTVKNSETGNVVRQFPDEVLLRVAHNLEKVKGLLQDDRI